MDNGASSPQPNRDVTLSDLATHQHGVVSVRQLAGLGLDKGAITRRLARARLIRVHRGVYAVGHGALTDRSRWMAAVLFAEGGAVLSHHAAARLWRIWDRTYPRIDVIATRVLVNQVGITYHRARKLPGREVTTVDGIPVTTVARTIVDLADVLTPHQLAHVLYEAAFLRCLDMRELRAVVARLYARRRIWVVHRAIELHLSGSAGTRSQLEDRMLARIEASDLPVPLVNQRFKVSGRRVEPDLRWQEAHLCVEVDGPGHDRPEARAKDAERERLLTTAGFRVLRFTARDIRVRPQFVISTIRKALAEGVAREVD